MTWRRRLSWRESGPAVLVLAGTVLFVAAVYVVIVRGGGALVGEPGPPNLGLSVLATAVVAILVEPVRRRLRPVAARLVRGERAAPYEVLTRFRAEVTGGYPTDEVPGRMAELLARATGARYAQVWLSVNDRLVPAATWPRDAAVEEAPPGPGAVVAEDPGRRMQAVHNADELLGVLVIQEHDRQPLTPAEEKLFAGLAAQAGLVLRAVRLRAELAARLRESAARAAELRASRERIVAAQDEERRRLERDIHDGAQQHLVALAVNLRLVRTLVDRSAERAVPVVPELKAAAAEAIGTLSDLSRGIYPRVLTDAGLGVALEAALAAGPVPVELAVGDVDRLPREVEAGLYFCCLEALQNAAKHAQASRVTVRVGPVPGGVELVVTDDGIGFQAGDGAGRGLANLRDRAESLGGTLRIDSQPGRGTAVTVRVPCVRTRVGVRGGGA
jgi:signal transduction histidine kinase